MKKFYSWAFYFFLEGQHMFLTLLRSSLVLPCAEMWKKNMAPPSTPFRMVKVPYSGTACSYWAVVPASTG